MYQKRPGLFFPIVKFVFPGWSLCSGTGGGGPGGVTPLFLRHTAILTQQLLLQQRRRRRGGGSSNNNSNTRNQFVQSHSNTYLGEAGRVGGSGGPSHPGQTTLQKPKAFSFREKRHFEWRANNERPNFGTKTFTGPSYRVLCQERTAVVLCGRQEASAVPEAVIGIGALGGGGGVQCESEPFGNR